jgi:hypothetical protein
MNGSEMVSPCSPHFSRLNPWIILHTLTENKWHVPKLFLCKCLKIPLTLSCKSNTSVNIMNMIQIETDNERIGAGIICIAVFAVLVIIWKYIIKTED